MAPSSGAQNGPPSTKTTTNGNDWMHNSLDMKVSLLVIANSELYEPRKEHLK